MDKNNSSEGFNDNSFNDGDDFNEPNFSFDRDWKPQDMNFDTFKLRNDPSFLLLEIKYYLMGVEEVSDFDNPGKTKLITKKNPITHEEVKPIVNQQGVEEILSVLKPLINNHNVMGNTSSENFHLKRMNFIGGDLIIDFWSKREKWNLMRDNVNPLIYFLCHQIDIFLTRTIGDAERTHYGVSFKESREVKPMERDKKNILSGLIPGAFKR